MRSIRPVPAATAAVSIFVLAGAADAASLIGRITCKMQPTGIKSISPETIATPGDGQIPLGIVRIVSAQFRLSDPVANGAMLVKTQLTAEEAWGAGLPNGHPAPPPNNMDGPWVGLMWPYRDFHDGYAGGTVGLPPGNSVGTLDESGAAAGRYEVRDIAGAMAYDRQSPETYMRGIPGNGANDFVRFFSFDLIPTVDVPRDVLVTLENLEVEVLVRDEMGDIFVERLRAPDVMTTVHIPAPGAAGLLGVGMGLAARRRRR